MKDVTSSGSIEILLELPTALVDEDDNDDDDEPDVPPRGSRTPPKRPSGNNEGGGGGSSGSGDGDAGPSEADLKKLGDLFDKS